MDDMCAMARHGKHVWGRGRAVPVSAGTAAFSYTLTPLPFAAEPRLPLPFGSGHVLPLPLTGPLGPITSRAWAWFSGSPLCCMPSTLFADICCSRRSASRAIPSMSSCVVPMSWVSRVRIPGGARRARDVDRRASRAIVHERALHRVLPQLVGRRPATMTAFMDRASTYSSTLQLQFSSLRLTGPGGRNSERAAPIEFPRP